MGSLFNACTMKLDTTRAIARPASRACSASASVIDTGECSDVRHGPEQPYWLIRKRQKALALIEATRGLILRVDDNRKGCGLATDGAKESVWCRAGLGELLGAREFQLATSKGPAKSSQSTAE